VLRNVQTDRGSLLHGRLLRWQFDTVTLAHRCRRGASTPSPFGGVAQRFQDLPLHPHTWLHLTVTNGSTDRYVNVHFDAITTEGQRLFIAEAPYELQTPTQAVKKHGKRADN